MADGSMTPKRMDSNAEMLIRIGEGLFSKKAQLDELWQQVAENFYPERADFTVTRIDGDDYAKELYESTPAQNRRDLAGSIGAILRPRGKEWFKPTPKEAWRRTPQVMGFCDHARDILRGQLYSGTSRFQVVSAIADDDFVSFGNAVPVMTENPERNGFLFEMTHLRDNAWMCNRVGDVSDNYRKFRETLRNIARRWGPSALSSAQLKTLETQPDTEVTLWHVVMPVDDIDLYRLKRKQVRSIGWQYASIYINPEAKIVMSEGGYFEMPYQHKRWRVPANSVYAYSPAAMLGLVDARVLQSQARIILDAGELKVAPPLLAKKDAILGTVKNYPASVTYLDTEYDERFGEAVRPLDVGGDIKAGLEMKMDTRKILEAAWFLNKLNLPSDKDMTAYEVSERVAEYIRSAGPVFEPFEADNARMLSSMFKMAMRLGYFGTMAEIPPEIRFGEIDWEFDTPVQQAYRRLKVVRARETVEALGPIAKMKPEILDNVDLDRMTRDTMEAIGGEAEWQKPQEVVEQERQARAQEMEQAKQLEAADKMAKAGNQGAGAMQKLGQASLAIPQLQQQLAGYLPMPGGEGTEYNDEQWPEPASDPMTDLGPGFGSVLDKLGRMPQGMVPGGGGGAMPPPMQGGGAQAPMPGGGGLPPDLMQALAGGMGGGARPPMRPQARGMNGK